MTQPAGPTVRDLQAMAAAAARPRRGRRRRLSRSARLHLVDQASRIATPSLALIAGVAIVLALLVGRTEPVRAAIWLAVLAGALFVARRLVAQYRAGEAMASRPFAWTSRYVAASWVVSAAFGSGALLLIYENSARQSALETLSALSVATFAASVLHAPLARLAVAYWAPTSVFCFLGAWRYDGPGLAFFGAAAMCAAGAAALYLVNRSLVHAASKKFPRTGVLRRSIDDDETLIGADADMVGGAARR